MLGCRAGSGTTSSRASTTSRSAGWQGLLTRWRSARLVTDAARAVGHRRGPRGALPIGLRHCARPMLSNRSVFDGGEHSRCPPPFSGYARSNKFSAASSGRSVPPNAEQNSAIAVTDIPDEGTAARLAHDCATVRATPHKPTTTSSLNRASMFQTSRSPLHHAQSPRTSPSNGSSDQQTPRPTTTFSSPLPRTSAAYSSSQSPARATPPTLRTDAIQPSRCPAPTAERSAPIIPMLDLIAD